MPDRRTFLASAAATLVTDRSMPADETFELRNYTLVPGRRAAFTALFEREFVESQEAVGARIVGTFRNLDDPDRFVWMRSFADMPARAKALDAFYTGPVWQAHRTEANASIVDSDNVLLLRPVGPALRPSEPRPPIGATEIPPTVIVATTYPLAPSGAEEFGTYFANVVAPELRRAGARLLATFATEPAPNNFPRLPVREHETVFVTLTRFKDATAYDQHLAALGGSKAWRDQIAPELSRRTIAPPQVLRLQPTARSRLR
jgi:quinol monooxygenase YgiN